MRFALLVVLSALLVTAARGEGPGERWLYCPTNMLVDANVEKDEALFARAAKAGYTHVLLSDTKLHKLGDMDAKYFKNVERVKQAAAANGLKIIPAVFPIGYSEAILWHDPNLAEGMPVKEMPLEVKGGMARLVADAAVGLKGGDFANLKAWGWHDDAVSYDAGEKALRIADPAGKNARISQKIHLNPYRQYHLSFRVKTQDFKANLEAKVLVNKASLAWQFLGVKTTQPWTVHHITFNSQEHTEGNLYIGCWGGTTGKCFIADAKLEETPFTNLLRRGGTPLVVTRENGEALVEGKDFEKLVDPLMGNKPWKGSFDTWHEPPVLKTNLPEGTRLKASYYHVASVYDNQVTICPSEPKTVELLRDEAKRVTALFKADGYFMSHDEIRVWNWCDACQKRHMDAGEILADNVRTCTKLLREAAPGAKVYVWSDMFDPNHNAHGDYYLVHGDYKNSWLGLDKDVVIALWYQGKAKESMEFFGGRGNRMMIAGYYDGPVANVHKWLDAAKASAPDKVDGVMYTTWRNDYSQIEAFAKELK